MYAGRPRLVTQIEQLVNDLYSNFTKGFLHVLGTHLLQECHCINDPNSTLLVTEGFLSLTQHLQMEEISLLGCDVALLYLFSSAIILGD